MAEVEHASFLPAARMRGWDVYNLTSREYQAVRALGMKGMINIPTEMYRELLQRGNPEHDEPWARHPGSLDSYLNVLFLHTVDAKLIIGYPGGDPQRLCMNSGLCDAEGHFLFLILARQATVGSSWKVIQILSSLQMQESRRDTSAFKSLMEEAQPPQVGFLHHVKHPAEILYNVRIPVDMLPEEIIGTSPKDEALFRMSLPYPYSELQTLDLLGRVRSGMSAPPGQKWPPFVRWSFRTLSIVLSFASLAQLLPHCLSLIS